MARDNPITAEEIAREAAEAAVVLSRNEDRHELSLFGILDTRFLYPEDASRCARNYRLVIEAAVLAAVERFAREAPVPGGLGEARLGQLRGCYGPEAADVTADPEEDARDLLRHVAHLTRALHDCGADGTAKVWAAGYEAGRAETERLLREAWLAGFGVGASVQKGLDVSAADAEAEHWREPGPDDPNGAAWHVRQAVRAAVLARAPPEG